MHVPDRPSGQGLSLWFLPLLAGFLPLAAAGAAFLISVSQDLIPACNPLIDGCASISRAGRHGLANPVFRALMMPAAVVQGVTWLVYVAWLKDIGASGRSLKWIGWLGALAAISLVVYATFLGTEGTTYRWLRRYGVIVYFGFTYLCMVVATGQVRTRLFESAVQIPARLQRALIVLLLATLLMGLINVLAPPLLGSEELKNRLENVLEWYVGLAFSLYFFGIAWMWRHSRLSSRFTWITGTDRDPQA